MMRRTAVVVALLATWWAGTEAQAAGERHGVAILVEGGDADAVTSALASHLPAPPYEVRDPHALRSALAAHGTRSLAAGLGGRGRDATLVAHVRAASSDAHVDYALLVDVRRGKRGKTQMHVWLVDAHGTGAAVDTDVPIAPTASASDQADAAWQAVASSFPAETAAPPTASPSSSSTPGPAPAPAAESVPPAPAAATSEATSEEGVPPGADTSTPSAAEGSASTTVGRSLLLARADLGAGSRHFSYTDRLTPTLRPYDLFAAPVASITLEFYPLAGMRLPVVSGLGVVGDYGRAVGLGSADSGGTQVATSWQFYDVGLRERLPLGARTLVGVGIAYGANDFDFDQPSFAASLPTVDYSFLRASLDARVFFGSFSLFGGGGYLDVLKAGTISGVFPRESVGGVDAFLGGAYLLSPHLEVSARVAYTRFYYAFNPQPGDAYVAGGALDEMARLSLGLTYLL
jgi:hypothetical protein